MAGDPPGEALRRLLDDLRVTPDDGRRAIVRATATLAVALGRRVEAIEIGNDAGLRVAARPAGAGGAAHVRWATVAEAALVPDPVDDATVDGVLAWSTLHLDRTACATASPSCASPPGRRPTATAPRCAWRRPARHSGGLPP
jgi:hypothetical protein